MISEWSLIERLRDLDLDLHAGSTGVIMASLSIQPQLIQRILELQRSDPRLVQIFDSLDSKPDFSV